MSAETISVRNFLVTVSQAAYLEQAPMTLHFINCFSSYWRYISRPDKAAPLKQELDMLMLIREVFISIPFFQNLEQLSNASQTYTALYFAWNSPHSSLELTGMLPGGSISALYEITI